MADSKRRQIRAKVISLLEGITTGNGYNMTINKVSRQLKGFEDTNAGDIPALFVINADERKQDHDVDDLKAELQVKIIGYVKSTTDPTDLIDQMAEDVEKAICVDRFLDDETLKVINVIPAELKTDQGTITPFGLMDFTFNITYLQLYGTP